tara:strand:+ start:10279 stop:10938 length:660 start_codon:yes stop_codon:yes gene_type:complete
MATTKIVDLIERAEIITQDKTSVRWPKSEWLTWYNDAILFVVNRRPDKAVKNTNFTVDHTNSRQTLPGDALSLFTATRNVSSGKPIRQLSRNQLDDQYDDWHSHTGDNIDHYIYDPRDPTHFYIYPRPTVAGHTIEIMYPFAPEAVVITNFETDTTVIGIDDSFLNSIIDFMLYRAYSKDADYAENGQRAVAALQAAESGLGTKTQVDSAVLTKENRNG